MNERERERRAGQRFNAELDVEWESTDGRFEGVLSDISTNGCFVLCPESVPDGQSVRIFVAVDDSVNMEFAGDVANSTPEIGFAVRFRDVSDCHRDFIARLIEEQ